jgi:phosphonate transport system substrate-binding protein
MVRTIIALSLLTAMLVVVLVGCSNSRATAPLGSAENPLKMAMVPSLQATKLLASGEKLAGLLQKETGYHYKVSVPTSYAAVIEALGAGKLDIAWLAPLSYVLAHDKYGARVLLVTIRSGKKDYQGFIIARTDTGINKLEDLKGKRFVFCDPLSTSGTIYPKLLLMEKGYDPEKFFSETVNSSGHDQTVIAVYNRKADGGSIYGGDVSDAREKVVQMIPDVMKKTKVIAKTDPIPNDTVSVRKDLPEEIARRFQEGLIRVANSDEGRRTVMDLYGIDGLAPAKDSDYDSVRRAAKLLGIDIESQLKEQAGRK